MKPKIWIYSSIKSNYNFVQHCSLIPANSGYRTDHLPPIFNIITYSFKVHNKFDAISESFQITGK